MFHNNHYLSVKILLLNYIVLSLGQTFYAVYLEAVKNAMTLLST